MRYEYITENTCARKITFDMEGNVVRNIEFDGGCNGNLKAIAKLLEGATVEEIVKSWPVIPAEGDRLLARINLQLR